MKSLFRHIAILLVLIGLSSCVENIEMEGMDSYYVVECLLTEGSRQGLRVSTKQAFPPLTEIEATISDLTAGGIQYEFSPLQNNIFSGYIDLTPIPGHEYMLSIRIDSRTNITAKTVFPVSAEMAYQTGAGAWESPYCIQVTVQKKSPDPIWMWGTYLSPSDYDPQQIISSLTAEITSDYPGTDSFNLINRKLSAYCTDESGAYMHARILRMDLDDNATFSVFPYSVSNYFLEHPERNAVQAICVSKELDRFLRETSFRALKQEGGDLIGNGNESWFEVYDHNNHYTNIQSGTGIFGAYVPCKMTRL